MLVCQRLPPVLMHGCRLVRQPLPLAPPGQSVRVAEVALRPSRTAGVIQKRHHRPLKMTVQVPHSFDKGCERIWLLPELPFRLIPDRAPALFATQRVNLAEVRIHLVTLALRQFQPCGKQFIYPGFLHGRKVQFREHATCLKVAGQQPVRHLAEKIARRVVTAHIPLIIERKPPALLDIVGCCCTQQ